MENLWTIKAILRCFELVSSLKVNFNKSRVVGINVEQSFKNDAAIFLNCKGGELPFKYLGLPIGANPRRIGTWQPFIEAFEKKLSVWKKRHLSLGGRITFINSVLNNLPIYFLSFFKAPKKEFPLAWEWREKINSLGEVGEGVFEKTGTRFGGKKSRKVQYGSFRKAELEVDKKGGWAMGLGFEIKIWFFRG